METSDEHSVINVLVIGTARAGESTLANGLKVAQTEREGR